MITREMIVNKLKERLEGIDYISAMWLEGSDAIDEVDQYSDIDIWVHFDDEHEEDTIALVERTLSELSEFDFKYVMKHGHSKIRQRIYHLENSNEYLMIDFCFQLNSRDKNEYVYIKDSKIENGKVIFDKDNIIRYKEENLDEFKERNDDRLERAKYSYTQHSRVVKYVYREQYLEAYAYYNKYVLNPLIDLLRLIYTPANADYYLIHISQHIPRVEVKKLEEFAKISSLEDIAERVPKAQEWFNELIQRIG